MSADSSSLQAELERARALIQVGADQLDRHEVVDSEEVFNSWEAKHERLRMQVRSE